MPETLHYSSYKLNIELLYIMSILSIIQQATPAQIKEYICAYPKSVDTAAAVNILSCIVSAHMSADAYMLIEWMFCEAVLVDNETGEIPGLYEWMMQNINRLPLNIIILIFEELCSVDERDLASEFLAATADRADVAEYFEYRLRNQSKH